MSHFDTSNPLCPIFDPAFSPDRAGLYEAVDLLLSPGEETGPCLTDTLPQEGIGELPALRALSPFIIGKAAKLGGPTSFAHMDPATPWITWAATLWNAALNQNLLHPATAPSAIEAEQRVIGWLAPFFGMEGGHMSSGSTIANLTALWAARDAAGVRSVAASPAAHISIRKAAHILGLTYRELPSDPNGRISPTASTLVDRTTALVLTAGHTATGAIDPLDLAGIAGWTHVDAAWAGPLRLSERHASLLDGIELADSVAISAHKWLFQPKEAAIILFRTTERANAAISLNAPYLARSNVGVQGSHGAVAVPLLATLLAFGRTGLAARLDRCVAQARALASFLQTRDDCDVLAAGTTGIVVWRPRNRDTREVFERFPEGLASITTIGGETWVRNVAANPSANMPLLFEHISDALSQR